MASKTPCECHRDPGGWSWTTNHPWPGWVATYLSRAGHDVQVAHDDGESAVHHAHQWVPDVIVLDLDLDLDLDLGLPGLDG